MTRTQRILLGCFGVFGMVWAAIMGYAEYPDNQFDACVMLSLGLALLHVATKEQS